MLIHVSYNNVWLFFRCVHIYSLAFSSDSMYLSASSNTETVHVFKLEVHKDR